MQSSRFQAVRSPSLFGPGHAIGQLTPREEKKELRPGRFRRAKTRFPRGPKSSQHRRARHAPAYKQNAEYHVTCCLTGRAGSEQQVGSGEHPIKKLQCACLCETA